MIAFIGMMGVSEAQDYSGAIGTTTSGTQVSTHNKYLLYRK